MINDQPKKNYQAIIICGPTASGKTSFAHNLATRYKGEVINCDSMQLYNLPIITASPAVNYRQNLPYHLYNCLPLDQEFSVVKYTSLAIKKIEEVIAGGTLPIIVGGTGMYINALLQGYSWIPSITVEVRDYVRKLQTELGQENFFNQLRLLDPLAAAALHFNDRQRAARAYEVFYQTGKSILSFHSTENIVSLPAYNFKVIFLCPERQFLYSVCNERLRNIFLQGGIEEVKSLKDELMATRTSIVKAVGVQEILAYLNDAISLEQAIVLAQNRTRQYAKRQITWFKHQIKSKVTLKYASLQEFENIESNFNIYEFE